MPASVHRKLRIGIFVLLCYCATISLTNADDDDNDEVINLAPATVVFATDIQRSSGLATTTLTSAMHQPEQTAYGVTLSWVPFLEQRSQYFSGLAELTAITSETRHIEKDLARQQKLYRAQAIAGKKLQPLRSKLQALSARRMAAQMQLQQIKTAVLGLWGAGLSKTVLASDSDRLDHWLSDNTLLLRIQLAPGMVLPASVKHSYIATSGDRSQAIQASFLSPAPQTAGGHPGNGYFFIVNDATLQAHQRISAWLPLAEQQLTGVVIPESALILYLNRRYVYRQIDDETFKRVAVENLIKIDKGYFLAGHLEPGQRIVTTGAHMLWSEEFRGRIPDEDDD